MKILVTGINGQLGHDMVKCLERQGADCVGASRRDFDLTQEGQTIGFIKGLQPDAVIHCAAYTAVDKAEDERALCRMANVEGAGFVARACAAAGAKMV
jgi:dTDP-4-dehydrorhamnose reductase